MDVRRADILLMKGPHPCGSHTMLVLRTGANVKLRCTGCGREITIPQDKIEIFVKGVQRGAGNG